MNKIGESTQTNISVLKNPFTQTSIKSISLDYSKVTFEPHFSWIGRINFTNGDTSGTQRFEVEDAEGINSFEVITKQIQEFINNLK